MAWNLALAMPDGILFIHNKLRIDDIHVGSINTTLFIELVSFARSLLQDHCLHQIEFSILQGFVCGSSEEPACIGQRATAQGPGRAVAPALCIIERMKPTLTMFWCSMAKVRQVFPIFLLYSLLVIIVSVVVVFMFGLKIEFCKVNLFCSCQPEWRQSWTPRWPLWIPLPLHPSTKPPIIIWRCSWPSSLLY